MTNLQTGKKLALNVNELAQALGISRAAAYDLTRREGFPALIVSERRIIIPIAALEAWLEKTAAEGIQL